MGTQRKERISAENLTARGKSFDLKNKKMTKESIRIFWLTEKFGKNCIYRHHIEPKSSTYVPREESFLISQDLHFWTKMRGRIGERSKHLRQQQIQLYLILQGKDGILYCNFTQEFVSMKKISRKLFTKFSLKVKASTCCLVSWHSVSVRQFFK